MADTPETSEFTSIKQRIEEKNSTQLNPKKTASNTKKAKICLKVISRKRQSSKRPDFPIATLKYSFIWSIGPAVLLEKVNGVKLMVNCHRY